MTYKVCKYMTKVQKYAIKLDYMASMIKTIFSFFLCIKYNAAYLSKTETKRCPAGPKWPVKAFLVAHEGFS